MNILLSLSDLQQNPACVTTSLSLRSGERVTVRLLTEQDSEILGKYFLGLLEETKRRYGPHPFNQETADHLCANINSCDTLRVLATHDNAGEEEIIAYFILILGVRDGDYGDVVRYTRLNIPLDTETDCTLAPSVADAYQNQGLGSRVLEKVFEIARRLGRKRMILSGGTQGTNDRAIHFYHKMGFQTVGSFDTNGLNNWDMILEL